MPPLHPQIVGALFPALIVTTTQNGLVVTEPGELTIHQHHNRENHRNKDPEIRNRDLVQHATL